MYVQCYHPVLDLGIKTHVLLKLRYENSRSERTDVLLLRQVKVKYPRCGPGCGPGGGEGIPLL
jgi:hypothetical protein